MDEYGGTFGTSPREAYENVWIGKIDNMSSLYAVDVEFWDAESLPTDLTAQLSIEIDDHAAIIEIDDVRVM